ncbi:unnamed protein product [Miscanthus lutarioriparius]|uniref:Integrator complex subunit 3 N-terminal domain-containing protein n=1 Tax=Miscanthus lutarioriparius TaxID=422564 RepID=A0A811QK68_9POAL|nr:unnamed protein product [Miscanthus lutarioriparius]
MARVQPRSSPAAAPGFAPSLASLLRRVPFPGDARLLEVLHEHASFLADEEPQLLATAVFAFLRLLSRNRLAPAAGSVECKDCEECKGAKNLQECRGMLVSFCVSMLQDHFQVCALLGRDLVRSLHELALVPEFQVLWRNLILDPAANVCQIGTPRWCPAVAITSEMEMQLLFMMNNVKWGDQKRYQLWFARKHLMRKEAIAHGVRSAFGVLVKKGVVPSLEPLTGCDKLSPLLRQKLLAFLSNTCEAAEEACGKRINEVSKGT